MSRQVAEDATPIREPEQLVEFFRGGAKPRARWGMGIEYERIGLLTSSGETLPFEGDPAVESVLRSMAATHGWEPSFEGDRVIELQKGPVAVSLEPGAQMEFVGSVHRHLAPLKDELCAFLADVDAISLPLVRERRRHGYPIGLPCRGGRCAD